MVNDLRGRAPRRGASPWYSTTYETMNRARVNYRANVPHEKKVKKKQKKMRLGIDFSDFLW